MSMGLSSQEAWRAKLTLTYGEEKKRIEMYMKSSIKMYASM